MAALDAVAAAAAAGRVVRAALLSEFFFTSSTVRVWPGRVDLVTGIKTWRPTGIFVSVDGLRSRVDLAAEPLTFRLSGVDSDLITIAKNSADEVKNNPCNVYLQFFNEDWSTLGDAVLVKSAIMDQLTYRAVGPTQREIMLTAEGIFVARNYAPYAFYTDRDQNSRFPDDRGVELMGSLVYKTVTWPDF